ncbi:hypothetical protein [Flavobacterium mesophilum]|uniref:hypothetical protein n=1 Tax=Flavobacterium mesophilum TaxID=3143495 RepID=UPI0031E0CB84
MQHTAGTILAALLTRFILKKQAESCRLLPEKSDGFQEAEWLGIMKKKSETLTTLPLAGKRLKPKFGIRGIKQQQKNLLQWKKLYI